MRAVVQRVKGASVKVEGEVKGEIGRGLLVLLAVHRDDREEAIDKMAEKLAALRIFEDRAGKMNLSVRDIGGGILVISQFTLYGDAAKGNRPGFTAAARPEKAVSFYEKFIARMKKSGLQVASGVFGADMAVALVNDGPVTLIIDL